MELISAIQEIAYIINEMREFQKNNNITRKCITNAQYLYGILKSNTNNKIYTKAVILVCNNEEGTPVINPAHIVVMIDDILIDPSYETFSLYNKKYFDNIKEFVECCSFEEPDMVKQIITHFLKFKPCENRINSGELYITDKDFYNNQADYIELMLKQKGSDWCAFSTPTYSNIKKSNKYV